MVSIDHLDSESSGRPDVRDFGPALRALDFYGDYGLAERPKLVEGISRLLDDFERDKSIIQAKTLASSNANQQMRTALRLSQELIEAISQPAVRAAMLAEMPPPATLESADVSLLEIQEHFDGLTAINDLLISANGATGKGRGIKRRSGRQEEPHKVQLAQRLSRAVASMIDPRLTGARYGAELYRVVQQLMTLVGEETSIKRLRHIAPIVPLKVIYKETDNGKL